MIVIGEKDKFAIEYEMTDSVCGLMEIWVNGISLCSYTWQNKKFVFWGYIKDLKDWLAKNIDTILKEDPFPFSFEATSSIDFEKNVSSFFLRHLTNT